MIFCTADTTLCVQGDVQRMMPLLSLSRILESGIGAQEETCFPASVMELCAIT